LANPSFKIEFTDLVNQFRNFWAEERHNKIMARGTGMGRAAAFPVAEGGSGGDTEEDEPSRPTLNNKDRNGRDEICLCGNNHPWEVCFYLIEDRRPPGWTPKSQTVEKVKRAINELSSKRAKKLKNIQKRATKEAKNKKRAGSDMPNHG
jgi:hypothetical protein